jgi:hypothetical protein
MRPAAAGVRALCRTSVGCIGGLGGGGGVPAMDAPRFNTTPFTRAANRAGDNKERVSLLLGARRRVARC